MRAGGVYVCGTDTGIGKTHVAVGLVHALRRRHGLEVAVMKPVASGCVAGRNDDAERLVTASGLGLDYAAVNPYALERPIAPRLAAAAEGRRIDFALIAEAFEGLRARADFVVVEGIGGVAVPLSDDRLQSDLIAALGLPALLVVGLRLGCINHALLSYEHLERRGIPCVGWIANRIDPACAAAEETIGDLGERIAAPLLGSVPHAGDERGETAGRLPADTTARLLAALSSDRAGMAGG